MDASLLLNWESGRTGRFSAALRRDMDVGQGSERNERDRDQALGALAPYLERA